jgi:hypothetical protein
MTRAPTLEQYLSIDTNFDPPSFSLDNTFNVETAADLAHLLSATSYHINAHLHNHSHELGI